jgi:hypothetical protein
MTIGGKERQFLFCLNSIKEFSRLENLTFAETFLSLDKLNLDQLINLFYACFKYGAKKDGQEVDFTADDVGDWLNEDMDKITECMKLIGEQSPVSKNLKAPQKTGQP